MNKQKYFIIFMVLLLGLGFSVFQYLKTFQTDFASATSTVSNPGHLWSSIECNSDSLCVDTVNNRLGIGTASPSKKLDIKGDIGVTGSIAAGGNIATSGDVCNGSGACLSQMASFVGSQPLVNSAHTYKSCIDAGGTVTQIDVSYPLCRFNASSCPTGWTQYQNWATWNASSASCSCSVGGCSSASYCSASGSNSGSTPASAWSNSATPCSPVSVTCYYGSDGSCNKYCVSATCTCSACAPTSARTQIGCY